LIFIHDDVHICDFFWPHTILDAMKRYDVVGIAGNKRRIPKQPSWAFIDRQFTWDAPENLSGAVGNGPGFPPQNISFFGPPDQEVKLLDGVLLAVDSNTLYSTGLRFDRRFSFHFYDLDFCRQAEVRKLTMGTCPISLIHESSGQFGTPEWESEYAEYLRKWTD
jgi:GT2 family glycosyltransferase